jgi:TatD DNase family protein
MTSEIAPLPELVDSHCHLDFPDFDGELEEIIARAHAVGVRRMVHICTKPHALPRAREIAESHDGVFFAYGIHPMSAAQVPLTSVDDLMAVAQHPKMVGIGETGLDYHYTADSAAVQQTSLRIHIEAAQETGLPLIIHARAADADIEAILAEGLARRRYSCVMHCFSSGARLAEAALEMGFYLSMSGIAAFPKSQELRDIFARVPLDRVLVETDSPYLAPPPHRGRRNEPAYTAFTARAGAQLFGVTEAEFAAVTTANFDRLFAKASTGKAA